jgi:hypothetical protein
MGKARKKMKKAGETENGREKRKTYEKHGKVTGNEESGTKKRGKGTIKQQRARENGKKEKRRGGKRKRQVKTGKEQGNEKRQEKWEKAPGK